MNDIKFVRINGRIVPIKQKHKDGAIAASSITAGTALTVGGGAYSGKLFKRARELRNKGRVEGANMKASFSSRPVLKDFGLRMNTKGKVIKRSGKIVESMEEMVQLSMIDNIAEKAAFKIEYGTRVKAYKAAFRSRAFLKGTRWGSSALIGLGVEKAVSASGIEQKNGGGFATDFISEAAGIGTSAFVHSVSGNMFDKIGKGIPLRTGFANDAKKGLKGLSKLVGKLKFARKVL